MSSTDAFPRIRKLTMQNVIPIVPRLCSLGLRYSTGPWSTVQGTLRAIPAATQVLLFSRWTNCLSSELLQARPASTSSRLAPAVFNPTSQPSVRALQADDTVVHHYRQGRPRCFWTRTARQAETAKFGSLTEQEYQNHPSKFRELPHSKLKTVFGPAIGKSTGNNLLRTLQKQRITGTLDQDINEKYVTPELVAQGLLWLRQNYKLDEDAAIIKRIQQENKQMEEKFIADVKYVPQQRAAEEGIYGKSRFEELRKANRAKAAAKEKQAEEIKKAHGNTTVVSNAKGHAVLAGRTESAEWVKRYKERAALSKMLEPPQMSLTKRLLPSTVFAALFLIICFTFASNYTPPIKEARIFPNTPPAAATVMTLISMNAIFFLMWRLPFFWRFMNKNFLLIAATPYPPSVLGNIFSHQGVTHLLTNMFVLWFVGTRRE